MKLLGAFKSTVLINNRVLHGNETDELTVTKSEYSEYCFICDTFSNRLSCQPTNQPRPYKNHPH